MNLKHNAIAFALLAAGIALAALVFRPDRQAEQDGGREAMRKDIERVIMRSGERLGRYEVQEAVIKNAVYLRYKSPSPFARFHRMLEKYEMSNPFYNPVWGIWENRTKVPYYIDLARLRFFVSFGADGAGKLTIVAPPPQFDGESCRVNLDSFKIVKKSAHSANSEVNTFARLESAAKRQIASDLKAQAEDTELLDEAREAAKASLRALYGGLLPDVSIDIAFSGETLPADAMEVAR